jgi:2'-5' RNA ligase
MPGLFGGRGGFPSDEAGFDFSQQPGGEDIFRIDLLRNAVEPQEELSKLARAAVDLLIHLDRDNVQPYDVSGRSLDKRRNWRLLPMTQDREVHVDEQRPHKTHTTAVVLIPPTQLWEPIQAIRERHDRHFMRWMPHITLVYPFRPRTEFDGLAERFAVVCRDSEPFRLVLEEVRFFRHGRESFTLWLAPVPKAALVRLQAALGGVVPDCNDVTQHREGFTPHLSIGQVRGEAQRSQLQQMLQANWQAQSFIASEISLIWRGTPPDDIFRVGQTIRLGL